MKKMLMRLISLLGIIIFLLTTASACALKLSEEEVKVIVRDVIKENPKLIHDTAVKYAREQKKKQQEEKQKRALEESFKNRIEDDISDNCPAKGPVDAPITIIEYTDFQCHYCAKGAKTVDLVMQRYPDKVRVVFKNNPLSFHKQALPAAKAALAADRQDKFWEYHDLLFKNSSKLNEKIFTGFARDLGLDMERFEKDRNSKQIATQIQSEQAHAAKHKLTGTPAFLVNGVAIKGAYPAEYFARVIDRLLKDDEAANQ
ncbi:MAG: thioredoxin domain-containing protein [Deltaproteobacteria bacterium]|jgi:protein-disulfide isomerase|nr:thioredoxin domain-containing protein [Deltaproteobacteria bacterium]